jgi:hypothetical protein
MILAIAILVGLYATYMVVQSIRPLFEGGVSTDEWQRIEDESMALLARRDRLVAELRDLEFEAALNKIDDADLVRLRARYESEALALVKELEEGADHYGERIAEQVSALLEGRGVPVAPKSVAPTSADPAPVVPPAEAPCEGCGAALAVDALFCDACGARKGEASVACAGCGTGNRPGARFCKGCGESFAQQEAS